MLLSIVAGAVAVPAGRWQMALVYDNNLFRLSSAELDSFRSSVNPSRFPYRSADDIEVMAAGSLRWLRGMWRASMRAQWHLFGSNWEKSYGVLSAAAGRAMPILGRIAISGRYLPSYLIRYLRDPTSGGVTRYIPCRYSEYVAGVEMTRAFGPLIATPRYRFEFDSYLPQFRYYDTKMHRPGVDMVFEPLRNLRLGAGYELALVTASGPVPDISYRQHQFSLGFVAWPQRLSRFAVDGGYSFVRRVYTTDNSPVVDPDHAGRADDISTGHFGFRYRLGSATVSLTYELQWREVFSPYRPHLDDVKDYSRNRLTLSLNLTGIRSSPDVD